VRHPRAVRRHLEGGADLADRLIGARFVAASRRGKYLWLPLSSGRGALVAHLGMSGQFLVQSPGAADERHLHVRISFAGSEPGTSVGSNGESPGELRFVDQRTFGGILIDELVPTTDRPDEHVPAKIVHIARDPLDPYFDDDGFLARLRRRDSAIKRALLDQTLVSGIGNIYADESLWRAGLHGERRAATLGRARLAHLLEQVRAVLTESLAAGGTSFDALYVNVNGQGGYFERRLEVYGREGEPCARCGTPVRRQAFMNRSSFFCPSCQRPPRGAASTTRRKSATRI
jgi:formamidopyrimidine-DNA glycosylase